MFSARTASNTIFNVVFRNNAIDLMRLLSVCCNYSFKYNIFTKYLML